MRNVLNENETCEKNQWCRWMDSWQGWEFEHSLFCSKSLILKCDVRKSQCEWFERIACKNERFTKKIVVFVCSFQFFPFLWPRANRSCRSSLIRFFLKSDLSDSRSSLFTKERPEGFAQVAHNKKNDREQFAHVAL